MASNKKGFVQGTVMVTSAADEARRDKNERNSAERQLRKYLANHLDPQHPALSEPSVQAKLIGLVPGSQEYLNAAIDGLVDIWLAAV